MLWCTVRCRTLSSRPKLFFCTRWLTDVIQRWDGDLVRLGGAGNNLVLHFPRHGTVPAHAWSALESLGVECQNQCQNWHWFWHSTPKVSSELHAWAGTVLGRGSWKTKLFPGPLTMVLLSEPIIPPPGTITWKNNDFHFWIMLCISPYFPTSPSTDLKLATRTPSNFFRLSIEPYETGKVFMLL